MSSAKTFLPLDSLSTYSKYLYLRSKLEQAREFVKRVSLLRTDLNISLSLNELEIRGDWVVECPTEFTKALSSVLLSSNFSILEDALKVMEQDCVDLATSSRKEVVAFLIQFDEEGIFHL